MVFPSNRQTSQLIQYNPLSSASDKLFWVLGSFYLYGVQIQRGPTLPKQSRPTDMPGYAFSGPMKRHTWRNNPSRVQSTTIVVNFMAEMIPFISERSHLDGRKSTETPTWLQVQLTQILGGAEGHHHHPVLDDVLSLRHLESELCA